MYLIWINYGCILYLKLYLWSIATFARVINLFIAKQFDFRENIPHKDYSKDVLSAEAERLIESKLSYLYQNKSVLIDLESLVYCCEGFWYCLL